MNTEERFQAAVERYDSGDLIAAAVILKEILSVHGSNTNALYLLAEISYRLGNLDDALEYLKMTLRYGPQSAEVFSNIGFILHGSNQLDQAIEFYEKAVHLNEELFEAYLSLGNIFREKGLNDKAVTHYRRALELNPESPDAHSGLGIALLSTGNYEEAVTYCRKAAELSPHNADLHYNLGIALQEHGRLNEAIECFRISLEMDPSDASACNNLAFALQENRQPQEALPYYRRALQYDPGYATAHWNLSLALLLTGNFSEGWREYEWRWETEYLSSSKRSFSQPLWKGSDIKGATILLHTEQGFGDTFQFVRYAPLVADQGVNVILECREQVASLMRGVRGIHRVVVRGEELPAFDFQCPLLSLPLAFDTTLETVPGGVPYISADISLTRKWEARFRHDPSRMKIGVVWAGNPGFKQNRYRNIPLSCLAPISEVEGVTLYSLQKGDDAASATTTPPGMRLVDYTSEIRSFSDTAAIISNLDLVVAVDTAVAHLAGAMGKPVWTLLPFSPEWRWLLDRTDSPWYPTMRLFRQASHGDWTSVIDHLLQELRSGVMA